MSQPALQPVAAPTALSDEEVIVRVLAGDTSLFEILMRRYNQKLFRVARSILTAWVLTFPAAGLAAASCYWLLHLLIEVIP